MTVAGTELPADVVAPGRAHAVQRADIQALRGFAVLAVLLYHAELGRVHAGFLGVDVFFVISGFLITTLVATGIRRGTFSFADFYRRRAKRLLPAAYVTYLLAALVTPLFLTQRELADFAMQTIGALTYSGNFVLWKQTGYFEGAANLKPLLHMWSLAVEEQYYLLQPATLFLARRHWLITLGVIFTASVIAYFAHVLDPSATFYLLPTRAWELLVGSLGALWVLDGRPHAASVDRALRLLIIPAVAYLVAVMFLRLDGVAAQWHTLAVCVATLVVILRHSATLERSMAVRALARVGDWSYSLYLVHWPIIAFINNAWAGDPDDKPRSLRIVALALSLAIAYVLYRTVEDPIRRSRFTVTRPVIAVAVLASILIGAIAPMSNAIARRRYDFASMRLPNYGLGEQCESRTPFAPKPACTRGTAPDLLVWGDSYAMHVVPALARTWHGGGIVQATRSECGPFLGLSIVPIVPRDGGNRGWIDEGWARRCLQFNDAVAQYVRSDATIKYVVLSSPISTVLAFDVNRHIVRTAAGEHVQPATAGAAVTALLRTVDMLHSTGKRVAIIAPPPSTTRDVSECAERQMTGKITIGASGDCAIDEQTYLATRRRVVAFLDSVSRRGATVIRFDPWLCDGTKCATMLDGVPLYRDEGHLTVRGSELVGERMHLGDLVRTLAR